MTHFSGQLRVRANGILLEQGKVLLVKIQSPTRNLPFWMPPGGGVQFGEPLEVTVAREFAEETGLEVSVNRLLFVSQYLRDQWHAIEFYFECKRIGGTLALGADPELEAHQQLLRSVAWVDIAQLEEIELVPEYLRIHLPELHQGSGTYPQYYKTSE